MQRSLAVGIDEVTACPVDLESKAAYASIYGRGSSALVLEERFAKGEIDKNEFEEKRKLLAR